MQLTRNEHRPLYVNATYDLCEAFRNGRLSPILRGIYITAATHSDMPLKCPIEKARPHGYFNN